ncbi:MAG TPA: hypothetical protein VGD12_03745 [Blastococcus sp.]|jgi:hypothetical protein
MTSTTTGLPDRYRPLDQVGPDEPTPTGVIRCWRAKDRVLNRDVAIRVHTPAGPAAHAWISRALTAGGLATPALAMVYDASEGTGDPQAPGGAAYVVNEWIDGETLTERLARGPLSDREARTVLRRLAEGIAEAHRVGLAVGGLTTENVVLRPNGLVGLRSVPAAMGTIDGDIAALGGLLEACLTGLDATDSSPRPLTGPSDLVALVRRARSSEPGQGLSSVAAMASLLAERPRTGPNPSVAPAQRPEESDNGWLRRLRDRRGAAAEEDAGTADESADAAEPVRLNPHTLPPVPRARPVGRATPLPPGALGGDTIAAGTVTPRAGAYAPPPTSSAPSAWYGEDDQPLAVLGGAGSVGPPTVDVGSLDDDQDDGSIGRRRLLVFGLPLLALIVVVGVAYWIGSAMLSVAGSGDPTVGSTPSASIPAPGTSSSPIVSAGGPVTIVSGDVFDPQGDGDPDHPGDVPLAFDGDPSTSWATYEYRGSPAFGNLKDGVGLLLDLGSAQELAAVTLSTTAPGATVEIRTGDAPAGDLGSFDMAADGTVDGSELVFDEPVTARYVLVWITGLVPSANGFTADISEVTVQSAG